MRAYLCGPVVRLVRHSSWTGLPVACSQVVVYGSDGAGLRALVDGEAHLMLDKAANRVIAGQVKDVPRDAVYAQRHPTLWSHLTQTTWPDGSERATSSLLIFQQDGCLKGMLRDREAGLCLWVAAPGLGALFEVLESALGDPRTEWRVDRQEPGQRATRKRKGA